ncbi:MAG: hypothetical protein C0617_02660 [Desulfuromonas sp.]|uniref:GumC family protein n=1 Tax=Desulfuromonas sp. TaxID=892 RepID=UPI000CC96FEA|nr:polysaccharide biosynthesis tyrosine autokinase [Desulfuromonas sp.]PLX86056.1 MAG: hypothetical protein C0617_02660 [Desulfuromonas sp.]
MRTKGQDLHLRDALRVVNKRLKIVLIFFSVTLLLVLVGTFLVTPRYEGMTKVMIERSQSSDLTSRSRAVSSDPEFYETQFQLIKSWAVSRRVVEMLSQRENYAELFSEGQEGFSLVQSGLDWAKGGWSAVQSLFGVDDGGTEGESLIPSEGHLAETISRGMRVRPIADSRILTISFLSPNPEFAALVANTTAKAYIDVILNMKMEASKSSLDWMTNKAEAEKKKLDEAEKSLQDFMKANDIVTVSNRIAVNPEKLSELSVQLVRAESKRKELEALYSKIKNGAENPQFALTVEAIASDATLRVLRSQVVESEKRIMELSNKYGPRHPVMIKSHGDLKVLEEKVKEEIRRHVHSIKNEYDFSLAKETGLKKQLREARSETIGLNEKYVQYGALKRDVETSRKLYDALMLKLKEQGITEENRPVNLWIVEEAGIPTHPVKPNKVLNMFIGLILGLFGGVGLAFFLDYLDNKIKDPEEAEAALGTLVLGMISLCRGKDREIEGIELKEPLSPVSEGYKALRTALMLSSDHDPPRKILVTSPSPGEGKTSTAVNLALGLAQSGKRVVLIDGDLRKPRVHKVFQINPEIGLSTYLAGDNNGGILQKGLISNLSVLPCGPIPSNPTDLLASSRMQALLEKLESSFDIIICDSSPLLSVTDSRILSKLFDGTLLVVRGEQTTYDMAQRALKSLKTVRANVLGIVINALDFKKGENYYYNDYYTSFEDEDEVEPEKAATLTQVFAGNSETFLKQRHEDSSSFEEKFQPRI